MSLLTRDQILSAQDHKTERVSIPDWGGDVFVRTLSASEWSQYENDSMIGETGNKHVDAANLRARLVILCCVDESKKQIFTMADMESINSKHIANVELVYDASMKINRQDSEGKKTTQGN